jgi:hypothetical protein
VPLTRKCSGHQRGCSLGTTLRHASGTCSDWLMDEPTNPPKQWPQRSHTHRYVKVPPCGGPICALHCTKTSAPRAPAPTGAAPSGVMPTQWPIPSSVVSDCGHTNLPGADSGMNSPLGSAGRRSASQGCCTDRWCLDTVALHKAVANAACQAMARRAKNMVPSWSIYYCTSLHLTIGRVDHVSALAVC